MKISIEKNLIELEKYLTDKGYTVVSETETADAVIYERTPLTQITARNFSPVSTLASDPVLLINAHGKTHQDIEMILQQKSYDKIF